MGAGHGTNVLTHGNLPVVSEAASPMLQKTPDRFRLGLTPFFLSLSKAKHWVRKEMLKRHHLGYGQAHQIDREGERVCEWPAGTRDRTTPVHGCSSTSSGHWVSPG
jgi:hypothetical protein